MAQILDLEAYFGNQAPIVQAALPYAINGNGLQGDSIKQYKKLSKAAKAQYRQEAVGILANCCKACGQSLSRFVDNLPADIAEATSFESVAVAVVPSKTAVAVVPSKSRRAFMLAWLRQHNTFCMADFKRAVHAAWQGKHNKASNAKACHGMLFDCKTLRGWHYSVNENNIVTITSYGKDSVKK